MAILEPPLRTTFRVSDDLALPSLVQNADSLGLSTTIRPARLQHGRRNSNDGLSHAV
jgi:hypothetical protein